MSRILLADDALVALLHFFAQKKGRKTFTADREKLHQVFYQLRCKDPEVLASISFRKRVFFPESAALDQALSNLEATGLLERRNESPRKYFVLQSIHKAYESIECDLGNLGVDCKRFVPLAEQFAAEAAVT